MSETKEFSLPADGNSSPPELLGFTRNTNQMESSFRKDKPIIITHNCKAISLVPLQVKPKYFSKNSLAAVTSVTVKLRCLIPNPSPSFLIF